MDLEKAIKILITQEGIQLLDNPLFVNHLMDLQAFECMPASKYILKMMCTEGSMRKICSSYQTDKDSSLLLEQYAKDMVTKWGFQKDAVDYTIKNIASALDWKLPTDDVCAENHTDCINQESEHFTFRNIEIGGNIERVVSELQSLGYNVLDRGREGALLEGSFAGERNCQILVSVSEFINEVESVIVMLQESNSWWTLKATYEDFKNKLTRKYGTPESIEEFYDPYYEGDGYEITALECQKAFYSSKFNADKGYIRVSIGSTRVYISYVDSLNESRIEERKNSIADFDL